MSKELREREAPTTCEKCGEGVWPAFFDGDGGGFVEFRCFRCATALMDSKAQRLFRVWQLSGLSDEEGTRLIEPKGTRKSDSIREWFDASVRLGQPLYSVSAVMVDRELYSRAIAKLIAVGRERRTPDPVAMNVVPFRRTPQ